MNRWRFNLFAMGILTSYCLATAEEPQARPVFWGAGLHFKYEWGMVVDRIEPQSTAEQIGLRAGDVIVEINGIPIRSLGHYHRLWATAKQRVALTVEQSGTGRLLQKTLWIRETSSGLLVSTTAEK